MNTTFAEKSRNGETQDKKYNLDNINSADQRKEEGNDKRSLLVMTAISAMVVLIAVVMIFLFIRNNPELVHANDQTTQVSENKGYVNPDSIQQLEEDTFNITLQPAPNSTPFVICGGVFMAVIAASYVYVKISEHKEDN